MRDKTKGIFITLISGLAFLAIWVNFLLWARPHLFYPEQPPTYKSEEFSIWRNPRASLTFELTDRYDIEFTEEYDFEVLVEIYKIFPKGKRDAHIFISLRKEEWEMWEGEPQGDFSGITHEEAEKFTTLLGADVFWTKPGYPNEDYAHRLFFEDPNTEHLDRWGRGQGYTIAGEYFGISREQLKEAIAGLKYAK